MTKWAVEFLYLVRLVIRDRMMKRICVVVVVVVGVAVAKLYNLQQWSFLYEKKTKASSMKGNDGFSLCYNSKRVEAQHMMSFPFARWIHHHVSVLPGNTKETKHWWWIESKILTMTCTAGGTESRKFGIESYYSTHRPQCDRCNRTAHHPSDGLPLQLCITFCSTRIVSISDVDSRCDALPVVVCPLLDLYASQSAEHLFSRISTQTKNAGDGITRTEDPRMTERQRMWFITTMLCNPSLSAPRRIDVCCNPLTRNGSAKIHSCAWAMFLSSSAAEEFLVPMAVYYVLSSNAC